jgi:MFS family permease
MCAACGVPTHVPVVEAADPMRETETDDIEAATDGTVPQPVRFAALRSRPCRLYLGGAMLAMMADNIEHVITYWVLWKKFHSPALAGFEVISHWLPFLLFSVHFGALADRRDCRRIIQGAQVLFMSVSACWGVLFLTGTLQIWQACVLLVLHGCAGSLWAPAEQLMLHDFVGRHDLPSAVRLNATARSLGVLFGPVVGSALLLGLGPTTGIFCNIAFYLPMTILMARTKFTGHVRDGIVSHARVGVLGAVHLFREVSRSRVLVAMIALAGLGSFFIGASMQSVMPAIASQLGSASSGTAYGVLLFANGAGGVLGGLIFEATGWLKPSINAAIWSTLVYGLTTIFFAFSHTYVEASAFLLVGGVANLASMSITQTVVQLRAPAEKRGQVIGLYNVSASGLRLGSGFTVGFLGAAIGLKWSLAWSSVALCIGTVVVAGYMLFGTRRAASVRTDAAS